MGPAPFPWEKDMLQIALVALLIGAEDGEVSRRTPSDPGSRLAEARKEARDRALRVAGKQALGFTRHYGEVGVGAILACENPQTAKRLIELHESGELHKLSNPRAALAAVCRDGEPAGAFLVAHCARLADPDALACFVAAPLDFAFELRDLDQMAAERRASRRSSLFSAAPNHHEWNVDTVRGSLILAGATLAGALLGYYLHRRRLGG